MLIRVLDQPKGLAATQVVYWDSEDWDYLRLFSVEANVLRGYLLLRLQSSIFNLRSLIVIFSDPFLGLATGPQEGRDIRQGAERDICTYTVRCSQCREPFRMCTSDGIIVALAISPSDSFICLFSL